MKMIILKMPAIDVGGSWGFGNDLLGHMEEAKYHLSQKAGWSYDVVRDMTKQPSQCDKLSYVVKDLQVGAPLADHGQSPSHQYGMIQVEVPGRMSPSLFRQVALPRPAQHLLSDNDHEQCTGNEIQFFPMVCTWCFFSLVSPLKVLSTKQVI